MTLTNNRRKEEEIEKKFDAYIKNTIKRAQLDYERMKRKNNNREIVMHDEFFDLPVENDQIDLPNIEELLKSPEKLVKAITDFENSIINEILYDALKNLSPRQKEILYLRSIFNCAAPRIAQKLGISVTRVKELNKKALEKMAMHFNNNLKSAKNKDVSTPRVQ